MTKRIEEEYARYIAKKKGSEPVYVATLNMKDLARHFYNMALDDVKKEAKRLSIESPFSAAASAKMAELVNFIDNQKQ